MSSLTINQEKQLRSLRAQPHRKFREHDELSALQPHYEELACQVALYRRAQKLVTKEAAEVRKTLLVEIDKCLDAIGIK